MRSALEGLDGVDNAKVSLDKDNAVVVFDSAKVTIGVMTEAVEGVGYGISSISEITPYKNTESDTTGGKKSAQQTTDYKTLTIDKLATLTDDPDVTLVNVHIPYAGEIPGTDEFIPFNQIENNTGILPSDKNAQLVLYCRSGNMSKLASRTLAEMGYSNVYDVPGGMNAWQGAGNKLLNNSQ